MVCGIVYIKTTEYGLEKTVLQADRKICSNVTINKYVT